MDPAIGGVRSGGGADSGSALRVAGVGDAGGEASGAASGVTDAVNGGVRSGGGANTADMLGAAAGVGGAGERRHSSTATWTWLRQQLGGPIPSRLLDAKSIEMALPCVARNAALNSTQLLQSTGLVVNESDLASMRDLVASTAKVSKLLAAVGFYNLASRLRFTCE